ncbi:MAG: hypothetical protein HY556_06105 [Euryarchaeota archaeon]|nr:hypothetical protein [Euryarchaeota archaeon]
MEEIAKDCEIVAAGCPEYQLAVRAAQLLLELVMDGSEHASGLLARYSELTVDESTLAFHGVRADRSGAFLLDEDRDGSGENEDGEGAVGEEHEPTEPIPLPGATLAMAAARA